MNEALKTDQLYTISGASVIVGVSTSTLKRWEMQHQIKPRRVANGQRIYSESDLRGLLTLKKRGA